MTINVTEIPNDRDQSLLSAELTVSANKTIFYFYSETLRVWLGASLTEDSFVTFQVYGNQFLILL